MLELDVATILWEAFNFLVLFIALYYILFRPAMRKIREQAEEKQRQMRQLGEDRAAVAEMRSELAARLASAEEEAESLLVRATNQAETDRSALLREAQAEVERLLAEAHMDAYRLKRQAVRDSHDGLLAAVLDVSGLVIGKVAPEELHTSMVQQLCDSIWEMGRSDMRRVDLLRRSLGDRAPTVVVRTAQALSAEQQGLVIRTFSALADRSINLDLKVEPSLGLGLQVRLGDLVMDNTIAGRLDELRESVVEALDERIADE
jgi:F-type H+-transporting ATPase subunit b